MTNAVTLTQRPDFFEPPPTFSDELLAECAARTDPMPVVFEWFKYTGVLAVQVAAIDPTSSALRPLPAVHQAVLRGLIARCAKLSLATVRVCHDGKHGETVGILARCIVESALKLLWLCTNPSDEKFQRFVADGLKKDLAFRDVIAANVAARSGSPLRVETRMLSSIQRCVAESGMDDTAITNTSRLPDLLTICRDVNLGDDFYTAIQRIGSHGVHGTWTDLVLHHLEVSDGVVGPRNRHVRPQPPQLVGIATAVLHALAGYFEYAILDADARTECVSYVNSVGSAINRAFDDHNGGDYEPDSDAV